MSEAVHIFLNGEAKALPASLSVAGLLEQMGLAGRRVAVEINNEIVPRSQHAQVMLKQRDRVEVVSAIGGG